MGCYDRIMSYVILKRFNTYNGNVARSNIEIFKSFEAIIELILSKAVLFSRNTIFSNDRAVALNSQNNIEDHWRLVDVDMTSITTSDSVEQLRDVLPL